MLGVEHAKGSQNILLYGSRRRFHHQALLLTNLENSWVRFVVAGSFLPTWGLGSALVSGGLVPRSTKNAPLRVRLRVRLRLRLRVCEGVCECVQTPGHGAGSQSCPVIEDPLLSSCKRTCLLMDSRGSSLRGLTLRSSLISVPVAS